MSFELNLTEDQRRRIDAAHTPEEKAQVLSEATRGAVELTEEQLGSVSGGYWRPSTKEEADEKIAEIQFMYDTFGTDIALSYLGLSDLPEITARGLETGRGIDAVRSLWYKRLGLTSETIYYDTGDLRGTV